MDLCIASKLGLFVYFGQQARGGLTSRAKGANPRRRTAP